MDFSVAARNLAVDAVKAQVNRLSLHSADPGPTGTANELPTAGAIYARQNVGWSTASNGVVTASGDITWDVPGGSTVAYVGMWSTGGTFMGADDVPIETFASQGQYSLPAANAILAVNNAA